jgi:hypothetical protein
MEGDILRHRGYSYIKNLSCANTIVMVADVYFSTSPLLILQRINVGGDQNRSHSSNLSNM